jgi:uncharacterized protein (DUF1501 family)
MMITRRQFAGAGLAGGALFLVKPSRLLATPPGNRRLIFVIQRGAMDGLQAMPAIGDPGFASARGVLGEIDGVQKLDETFGLHPALVNMSKLYAQNQALFVHAVASPYRDRSHFDGQNVLESGGERPFDLNSGWLNRLMSLQNDTKAIALTAGVPLALSGPIPVASFQPGTVGRMDEKLMASVDKLYAADPMFHALWSEAVHTRGLALDMQAKNAGAPDPAGRLAKLTAGFLREPDGPRIAMIETQGWDTHSAQISRLRNQFSQLDTLVNGLQTELGDVWPETLVIVATEFGRTVAINGTGGTDHGTGTLAMLFGGTVRGGRVIADWPGLKPAQLYEGRDLRPTGDLHAVIAGAVAEHFGLPADKTAQALFPERAITPLRDIVRT